MSWLDDLETRLEGQLEAFLQANPAQRNLLEDQEAIDNLEALRREQVELQELGERQRQRLLQLAEEIRRWQERVERARTAGADDLAGRAATHVQNLMEQGRSLWQQLQELGQRHAAIEWELSQRQRPAAANAAADRSGNGCGSRDNLSSDGRDLQSDWAAFEAQQELELLRARMQR
jgi:hercynine metabolism protein